MGRVTWPGRPAPGDSGLRTAPHLEVRWHRGRRCFVKGTVPLRGVRPTLTQLFYPQYNYKAACHGPITRTCVSASERARGHAGTRVAPTLKGGDDPSTGAGHLHGQTLGGTVDRQVTAVAKLLARHGVPAATFASLRRAWPPTLTGADLDRLAGWRLNCHPYTREVFAALHRQGWEPVDAQVPCGAESVRVGTAVDLVCRPRRSRSLRQVVLIELKCGFRKYLRRYAGHMNAPYTQINDSPFYQHQLQLNLTRLLFEHTFPQHRVVACALLQVHEEGVVFHAPCPRVRALNPELWSVLRRTRTTAAVAARQVTIAKRRRRALNQWSTTRPRVVGFVPAGRVHGHLKAQAQRQDAWAQRGRPKPQPKPKARSRGTARTSRTAQSRPPKTGTKTARPRPRS